MEQVPNAPVSLTTPKRIALEGSVATLGRTASETINFLGINYGNGPDNGASFSVVDPNPTPNSGSISINTAGMTSDVLALDLDCSSGLAAEVWGILGTVDGTGEQWLVGTFTLT